MAVIEVQPYRAAMWPPERLRQAQEDFAGITDQWLSYQSMMAEQGWAWMAVAAGQPLAAAGCWLTWPGVAQVWAVMTRQPPQVMAVVLRKLARMYPEFCRLHRLRRLQAIINPNAETIKLAKFMDMHMEGELPGYGVDGRAWHLYGKVLTWDS
jgi:hypothetical protein